MQYYPLFLDIKNKDVLVIGGGNIGLEKIQNLLKAGPKITVISPQISLSIRRFNKRIHFIEREVLDSDIQEKYCLIFCATGDSQLNARISAICLKKRILCNTVDDPQYCHFIVPSILRRGYLTVAISTAGVSPSLAKHVKAVLAKTLGVRYTQLTRWLAHFRDDVRSQIPTLAGRMAFWTHFYKQKPLLHLRKEKGLKSLKKMGYDLLKEYRDG